MSRMKPLEMTERAARRANARRSRGPATSRGKASSATSKLRHGFHSGQQGEVMVNLGWEAAEEPPLSHDVLDN